MANVTYKLLACFTLVFTATAGHAATISPQQLLPPGHPDKIQIADTDSSVTTLPETPKNSDGTVVIPPQGADSGGTVIIVPSPSTFVRPNDPQPSTPSVVQPITPDESRTIIVPTIPQPPSTTVVVPDKTIPVKPQTQIPPPPAPESAKDKKLLTPADFLPKTPTMPEKDKKAEKTTPDQPKKKSAKGDTLKIPPDATKARDLSFLEGCWRGQLSGTRNKGKTSEQLGSRFCFDKNGHGKHILRDLKENCVGSANGSMGADGTLRVDFGDMYCPSGEAWHPLGSKYMTCKNVGGQTQCVWHYPGSTDTTGPFYRE
ncbi:MAG: hypothetical protein LBO64_10795 [Desulfovibrio sp.]|jgi:hypothetical protein|nr:hypothetical protein [Desulfovibrio sp.]